MISSGVMISSGLSSSLVVTLSDSAPLSAAKRAYFNGTSPVIVGNDGMASLTSVGLGLFFETPKVGVKGGVTKYALGGFVGLAVGDFVGLVPGTIGGQVFLQIVWRLQ